MDTPKPPDERKPRPKSYAEASTIAESQMEAAEPTPTLRRRATSDSDASPTKRSMTSPRKDSMTSPASSHSTKSAVAVSEPVASATATDWPVLGSSDAASITSTGAPRERSKAEADDSPKAAVNMGTSQVSTQSKPVMSYAAMTRKNIPAAKKQPRRDSWEFDEATERAWEAGQKKATQHASEAGQKRAATLASGADQKREAQPETKVDQEKSTKNNSESDQKRGAQLPLWVAQKQAKHERNGSDKSTLSTITYSSITSGSTTYADTLRTRENAIGSTELSRNSQASSSEQTDMGKKSKSKGKAAMTGPPKAERTGEVPVTTGPMTWAGIVKGGQRTTILPAPPPPAKPPTPKLPPPATPLIQPAVPQGQPGSLASPPSPPKGDHLPSTKSPKKVEKQKQNVRVKENTKPKTPGRQDTTRRPEAPSVSTQPQGSISQATPQHGSLRTKTLRAGSRGAASPSAASTLNWTGDVRNSNLDPYPNYDCTNRKVPMYPSGNLAVTLKKQQDEERARDIANRGQEEHVEQSQRPSDSTTHRQLGPSSFSVSAAQLQPSDEAWATYSTCNQRASTDTAFRQRAPLSTSSSTTQLQPSNDAWSTYSNPLAISTNQQPFQEQGYQRQGDWNRPPHPLGPQYDYEPTIYYHQGQPYQMPSHYRQPGGPHQLPHPDMMQGPGGFPSGHPHLPPPSSLGPTWPRPAATQLGPITQPPRSMDEIRNVTGSLPPAWRPEHASFDDRGRSPTTHTMRPPVTQAREASAYAGQVKRERERDAMRRGIPKTTESMWQLQFGWNVLVRCDQTHWKLHRNILEAESPWFRERLPPHNESKGYVEFNCDGHDVNALGHALWFMYHSHYDYSTLPPNDPLNGDCIRRNVYQYICGVSINCPRLKRFAVSSMNQTTATLTEVMPRVRHNPALHRLCIPLTQALDLLVHQGNTKAMLDMRVAVARLVDVTLPDLVRNESFRHGVWKTHWQRELLPMCVVDSVLFQVMGYIPAEEADDDEEVEEEAGGFRGDGGDGDEDDDEGTVIAEQRREAVTPAVVEEVEDGDLTPKPEKRHIDVGETKGESQVKDATAALALQQAPRTRPADTAPGSTQSKIETAKKNGSGSTNIPQGCPIIEEAKTNTNTTTAAGAAAHRTTTPLPVPSQFLSSTTTSSSRTSPESATSSRYHTAAEEQQRGIPSRFQTGAEEQQRGRGPQGPGVVVMMPFRRRHELISSAHHGRGGGGADSPGSVDSSGYQTALEEQSADNEGDDGGEGEGIVPMPAAGDVWCLSVSKYF